MNGIVTFFRESSTARFLIPTGIILLVCGIIFFVANTKNQNYIKTEATITKVELEQEAYTDVDGNHVEASYKVSLEYTVDEKTYKGELGGVSKYEKGDIITIYYDPEDPNNITQTKSLLLPIIFIVSGIGILIGGIINGYNSIQKYKKMKEQEKGWSHE